MFDASKIGAWAPGLQEKKRHRTPHKVYNIAHQAIIIKRNYMSSSKREFNLIYKRGETEISEAYVITTRFKSKEVRK